MAAVVVAKHKRTTLERVSKFISSEYFTDINLRGRLYPNKHPLTRLQHFAARDRIPYSEAIKNNFSNEAKVGDSFGPIWSTHWFKLTIDIPASWVGKEVRLKWDSSSEAMVWKDGIPVQGLSDERKDFVLTERLTEDACRLILYIEMACNEMFGTGNGLINPPDKNKLFTLSKAEIVIFDRDVYNLIMDFEVLIGIVKNLPDDSQRGYQALYTANTMVNMCNIYDRDSYKKAKDCAKKFLSQQNGDSQHTVHAMGHCHIDSAWLWTYGETKRKCARSWSSTLRLIEKYPDYIFTCSQAQQFEWLKDNYPELYKEIKTQVTSKKFIPVGGCWVEMDGNLPSGESFIRQFLYGQRFFKNEFGMKCKEFWLPDTFGYSAQLPQIMKGAGIERFVTQKLSWSLVNKFPHNTFVWEGLDGSQVLTHFPPGDCYTMKATVEDLLKTMNNNKDKGRVNCGMMLYGHGDGGGGPTEDMLERLTRLKDVDALPRIKMSTPEQFFKELEDTSNDLCKWIGELYLELHQGTFTTQAMIKKYNRKLEILLHDLELTASMAMLANASYKYPQEELSEMWKKLLLNQFHDVLPGSCIALVVEDALQLYKEVEKVALTALTKARNSLLSAKQSTTGTKLLAFNTYSWERTEVVSLPSTVDTTDETPIKKLKTSVSQIRDKQGKMLAVIHVPSMGYSELKPYEESLCNVCISDNSNGQIILENDSLRATIDNVGRIVSLVHKASKREAIATGCYGNQFVLYDDVPLFWDAWDVMDYHLETRKPVTTVKSPAYIVQDSTLSCAIAVSLQISEKSYIEQTISLDATSKYLKFDTKVEWNENRKFLKVEIPVTVRSLHASYDIQFGHLQRPTHGNTSWDWARYEVVGHKWVDLSEYNWGVSVFNDCKYGHCTQNDVIRLSLLKAPKAPDPEADMGMHQFRYAVMPHTGTFQGAGIVQEAYNFNNPLQVFPIEGALNKDSESFFALDNSAVILETVKKTEDTNDALVLRLYEAYGSTVSVKLTSLLPIKTIHRCNILEEISDGPEHKIEWKNDSVILEFKPFEIMSLLVYI